MVTTTLFHIFLSVLPQRSTEVILLGLFLFHIYMYHYGKYMVFINEFVNFLYHSTFFLCWKGLFSITELVSMVADFSVLQYLLTSWPFSSYPICWFCNLSLFWNDSYNNNVWCFILLYFIFSFQVIDISYSCLYQTKQWAWDLGEGGIRCTP